MCSDGQTQKGAAMKPKPKPKRSPLDDWRKTNAMFFEPRHLRVIEPVRRPK
jgi:hypothetical protein